MFQYGNYEGNRLDIGRIDLGILADLGHTVKTFDGLPLFELVDNATNLNGSAAGDLLYGDYHGNVLTGQAGGDVLLGGGGGDRLDGGLGADWLGGGTGADVFVFASLADSRLGALRSDGHKIRPDIIADFASGTDKIDLSALDAASGTPGNQAFTFIGANAFSGQAGELRYETHGDYKFIYADLDGDGYADLQITAATPLLQTADFIL
jgi:Ca2+-binding RTX toxin-like protein